MITISGKELLVPKPSDRLELVRYYHGRTGHWGIRRTLNLLWQRHYWVGLKQDVKAVVTQCETCQRVKTHYAREEAMLTPLEIKFFMYRWSLDLAWPTKRVTKAGNQRVLKIMAEHYTRFIVCVPIPNKEASTIAGAFRNHVMSVFGAPAECLVDGGTEFEGDFADLCRQCLIDRRVTSPDSPEGNGLTERPELNFEDQEEKTLADDLLQRANIVKKLMVKDRYDCSAAIPSKHLACEKYARLLPADVGPHRAVSAGREQPWQAPLTSRQTEKLDGTMGDLPDRVEWGDQEVLSKLTRTQVKVVSQLDWGLELAMAVPHEVKRLANEVD
eukprot:gene34165-biopygen17657